MLDAIILFSIKRKLVIILFTLALVGWGTYSITRLPIDAVPDITDNQVMVITVAPSLAAQEVEQLVTFPVEQSMVSIPNIKDMRSFSRFGLSIVTIVFEEHVDLYWGRQQVQERITLAAKDIPESVGRPEMAPVTTGLGEIYQYVVHPQKGYEQQYSATELRTIQDWIIKRQLLGTPGVAEVSGFGGLVKQYEIAINPDMLRSMDVSIPEIFTALQKNNQNTGGAYIDKNPNAYFIRSEGLVKNLDEIAKIVIKLNGDGTPILVRDVATARFGHGVRYGAATRNGEGEVVTGIVMMLKGANSSQVITAVKERIEQIKQTLPEGVTIEAFLDRKKLVDNAITTVTKNLAEGALIVVFVLVLFLGNVRGGLVVASVIPLSMLFAVSMMNVFGVSGNLMSLGAIDFGLIVDGAVIIVEAAMHRISQTDGLYPGVARLSTEQMDSEVYESTRLRILSSASGQIIILTVYLPLLALIGVEGKMFRPMAQTVSFAILGAFLLSITYVPMMSALALSRQKVHKRNYSDHLMAFFQRLYYPVITRALTHKSLVVGTAVGLFAVTLFAFSTMGSEFIPQLDEGDFAVETRVPVGSSIEQMIEVSQKAQTIILQNFPEVLQVVNKIGSGEIPTDPMPIEAGDMMVILKPHNEWTTADNREELATQMQAALAVIPNATFSFQQPIQMRFNELLTGAKQDVVIKIYGEDLSVLSDLASDVGRKINRVEGVEDLYVEQITGLPQIQITMNRARLAQYGMNVADINQHIETAFAGKVVGLVYEGERRFELVLRLDSASRVDITDVENLYVTGPRNQHIPLREVATVAYEPGPVQIQRDNAKRRITIGFNVRNRDVKSIVTDIQAIVKQRVSMPAGYYVSYGGQFQNLEEANRRLSIAVPVALFLILVLLFFTFGSISQTLLIFTAIPLSAIGGVVALLVRGMPFSISAGVGFIALFGVAVLNGIVLIAEFNRLAQEGVVDIRDRILIGTRARLRPVLMTATVASLGFLPMALSTSSGAEVQRPLATVVIGGLISATLLTLIVLPVLYSYVSRNDQRRKASGVPAVVALCVVAAMFVPARPIGAQPVAPQRQVTLQEAIAEALKNNGAITVAQYGVDLQRALRRGSLSVPRTDFSYTRGEINSPAVRDGVLSVSQRIEFPTVYRKQSQVAGARVISSERNKDIEENTLVAHVKTAYLQYQYVSAKHRLLLRIDSLYSSLDRSSRLRYEAGETTRLESITASTRSMRLKNSLEENLADIAIAMRQLQVLLNSTEPVMIADTALVPSDLPASLDTVLIGNNPELAFLRQSIRVSERETSLETNKLLPDILLSYSRQSFNGGQTVNGLNRTYASSDRFSFYQLGVALPLFSGSNRSRIAASKVNEDIARSQLALSMSTLRGELQGLIQQHSKHQNTLQHYQQQALPQATLIIRNSDAAFRGGDISYLQHVQNLTLASDIESEYLDSLYRFNQSVIDIATILGIH